MASVRLRQVVLVARELEPAIARLRAELGFEEPYRDPGVAEFGLENAVFAVGDCFVEIVSPTRPGTAAGRQLERSGGDGGYMALFDLEDLDGARERAEQAGVRTVWRIDLPDISGTHMHPADMGGTIVSLDRSLPFGTWRWGGPAWTGRQGVGAAGRLTGMTVAVEGPAAAAERWARVLGVAVTDGELTTSDGATVHFVAASEDRLTEISLSVPDAIRRGREEIAFGSARILLTR
jgi:Glyoxalase-like domain